MNVSFIKVSRDAAILQLEGDSVRDNMAGPVCGSQCLRGPLQFTLCGDSDAGVEEFTFVDSFMPPSGVHLQHRGSLCDFFITSSTCFLLWAGGLLQDKTADRSAVPRRDNTN